VNSVLKIFFPLVLIVTVVYSAISNATDAYVHAKSVSDAATIMFHQQKFAELNSLEEQYRSSKERLPDGRWKLDLLFSGLSFVRNREKFNERNENLKLTDQWIAATPLNAAPYLAKATVLLSYADNIQSRDFKNDSADKKSAKLRLWTQGRITQARKVLEESADLSQQSPYWYVVMESIALAQGWGKSEFTALYEQASNRWPTYYAIHEKAVDYQVKQWREDKVALAQLVQRATERANAEEGRGLYARLYWSQLNSLGEDTFDKGYANWQAMSQGFRDIEKRYPQSALNLNAFTYYACLAQDWEMVRTLIPQFSTDPHLDIWISYAKFFACGDRAGVDWKNVSWELSDVWKR